MDAGEVEPTVLEIMQKGKAESQRLPVCNHATRKLD
jgi:hypothetical protein